MPNPASVTLSPVELVLRVSAATVGASEHPPNTNAGPYVERVQRSTGNKKGDPWCASWVTDIGTIALGKAWPVRRTASCALMGEWAAKAKCRYVPTKTPAAIGDLFLLFYPSLKRFAHVGLVIGVEADGKTIYTREANTSGGGSREGWLVAERKRVLTDKDRLIRWAPLVTLTPE